MTSLMTKKVWWDFTKLLGQSYIFQTIVMDILECVNLNDVGIPYCTTHDFSRVFINYAKTTVMCFVLFLKKYQNLLAKDIKCTAFQNSTLLGKVCSLPIIAFWNHLELSWSVFVSAYLSENSSDSIVRKSLEMSTGGLALVFTWKKTTCAELEITIGVRALQIRHGNKFGHSSSCA